MLNIIFCYDNHASVTEQLQAVHSVVPLISFQLILFDESSTNKNNIHFMALIEQLFNLQYIH